MANLKEVRTRIGSVNSTMQITAAMKVVSASKLRKSQSTIAALRPYASKLKEIMQRLSSSLQTSAEGAYAKIHKENPEDEKILLIPVASNKGLCGVFNVTVLRETLRVLKEDFKVQYEKGNVDILCISKKIEETLRFRKYRLAGSQNELLDNLSYENTIAFAERLMKDYVDDGVNDGTGEFTGFLRESNDFDHDTDFTGSQKDFEAMLSDRESKPVIEFTVVK
ncbi:MAG: F0F1 ATP synthase subunit gamma [Bacteroidales bacterium]|nr:F0F1 ATP synthase subunit gamma [Bacteroidales bacterium]